ncbi:MAG: hypothetical protein R2838_17780 [Caldilineaceae bacterium]
MQAMHVDGFRFDLASILSRDEHGDPMANPPILWDIENDPVLAGTKLIAEAWDAAGLYQVGQFFGRHWTEWNGRFRDDVRSFVKGDPGMAENHGRNVSAAARTSTAPSAGSRSRASTSSPATTASRSTIWSRTTRSTTRPTARATGTVTTTIAAGTTARKGRPTTRPSRRCGGGRSRTSSR